MLILVAWKPIVVIWLLLCHALVRIHRVVPDWGLIRIAVGTHIAMRPPHKTGRAAFPHPKTQ